MDVSSNISHFLSKVSPNLDQYDIFVVFEFKNSQFLCNFEFSLVEYCWLGVYRDMGKKGVNMGPWLSLAKHAPSRR